MPYYEIILTNITHDFPGGSDGKESACKAGTLVWTLDWEDPLEEGMATYSSIFAWRIPWREEPGKLSPQGRWVKHDWSDLACMLCERLLIATFFIALCWIIVDRICAPVFATSFKKYEHYLWSHCSSLENFNCLTLPIQLTINYYNIQDFDNALPIFFLALLLTSILIHPMF